jgi:hypothetical protein
VGRTAIAKYKGQMAFVPNRRTAFQKNGAGLFFFKRKMKTGPPL